MAIQRPPICYLNSLFGLPATGLQPRRDMQTASTGLYVIPNDMTAELTTTSATPCSPMRPDLPETFVEGASSKSSSTIKIGKEAFYNQLEMQVEEAYSYTGMVMAENMGLKDTQEGILAFLEKRTPKWDT